jgi:hypothetical protein
MVHHISKGGNFQSDKYPWLPENHLQFSWKDEIFIKALRAIGWRFPFPRFGKMILSFEDPLERHIIYHYALLTKDMELGEDIKQILINKFGYDPEEFES